MLVPLSALPGNQPAMPDNECAGRIRIWAGHMHTLTCCTYTPPPVIVIRYDNAGKRPQILPSYNQALGDVQAQHRSTLLVEQSKSLSKEHATASRYTTVTYAARGISSRRYPAAPSTLQNKEIDSSVIS